MTDTFDSKTCPQSPQEQYSDIVIEGGGGEEMAHHPYDEPTRR